MNRPARRNYVVEPLPRSQPIGRYAPPHGRDFSWLYIDAPFGREGEARLWLAHEGDDIGGNLGCIEQPVSLRGAMADSCYLLALHVDPTWRRQGVATRLLESIRARHAVMLMVGMTPAARAVYERLEYEDLGRMVQLFRVVNPLAFGRFVGDHGRLAKLAPLTRGRLADRAGQRLRDLARRRAARRPPPAGVDGERPTDAQIDELWARVAPTHEFIAARSAAWVRWRYWSCPHIPYAELYARDSEGHLLGYAISKRFRDPSGVLVGVIVDVCVQNEDTPTFEALVEAATRELLVAGVDLVKCAFTSRWARRRLRRQGFLDPKVLLPNARVPGRQVFMARRADVPTDLGVWWMTRGDSEMDFNDAPQGSEYIPAGP